MTSPEESDFDTFDPLHYVEEDRDVLERIAQVRQAEPFPAHLLTTDPAVAREIVRKARAEKKAAKIKPPHPPPEVRARPAEPSEIPRSVKGILKLLGGWEVTTTYARGCPPGRWKRIDPQDEDTTWVTTVTDSIIVRARQGSTWFAATWYDGKSKAVYWIEDTADREYVGLRAKPLSITELKVRLNDRA